MYSVVSCTAGGWGGYKIHVGDNIQPNLDNRYLQCRVLCAVGGWGGYKIHVGDNIQPHLKIHAVHIFIYE